MGVVWSSIKVASCVAHGVCTGGREKSGRRERDSVVLQKKRLW